MSEIYKIVFAGEMGAGKTTAINTLSDTKVVSTDVTSNIVSGSKVTTTVGMDYGSLYINEQIKLLLFGTPGQKRFDFMWQILAKGSLGTIIFLKANSKTLKEDLVLYVDEFLKYGSSNIILALTFNDVPDAVSVDEIQEIIYQSCSIKNLAVFACDPREKEDMLFLLEILVSMIEADITMEIS